MGSRHEDTLKPAATADTADDVDAGEDGDFVTLRENREVRIPETVDLTTADLTQILELASGSRTHALISRPTSSSLRRQTAIGGDTLWAELTEAALNRPAFSGVLSKIMSEVPLTSSRLQNPYNKQNILNFVLELGDHDIVNAVIDIANEELIEHRFQKEVMKITGHKNALHQAVENNNLDILKNLLRKIRSQEKRISILNEETPIEIKGQRPRTFPCLHLASYHGFKDIVEYILDQGVGVNHLNAKNDTALLWAARWGHVDTIRSLLSRGALADLENDKGSTALYWAVRYGHTTAVNVLATEGKASVNKQRKLGLVAPVVLASALGLTEILSILIKFGADPNTTIRGKEKPIHHAAKEGFSSVIEILVAHGAEVDAADARGDTALLLASKYGTAKALQTLLKLGANTDCKNSLGENVWKFAITGNNDLILKLLVLHLKRSAMEYESGDGPQHLHPTTAGSSSLLFLAAAAGSLAKIRLLFQLKTDGSTLDTDGNTFLHIAAIHNQPHVIKEFHKMANIDSTNNYGNTALHEACSRGYHEVIVQLISVKVMANIRNKRGETALHVAAKSKSIQPNTVSLLMDFVIKTHSWECLHMLDNYHNSALHTAAKYARPDILWEYRFVSLKEQDGEGNTALHNAIRPGEPEVLDMMLNIFDAMKMDSNINHQNAKGESPLFLAAREGFIDNVKRLMHFGADISLRNSEGNSVLHMLTSLTVTNHVQCERFLEVMNAVLERAPVWYQTENNLTADDRDNTLFIKRRAVLKLVSEITNNKGLTVFDLACKVGAYDVIQLLVNMENIMAFEVDQNTRYDITSIIPRTNGSSGLTISGKKVVPRPSCLDWLLIGGNMSPQNVVKVLDMQPFSDIEAAYGTVANWSHALALILHILYMSVFSWSGLTMLNDFRVRPGEKSINAAFLVTCILVPIEPAIILFYNLYSLIKLCCCGEMSVRNKLAQKNHILKSILIILFTIVYAIFVIVWVITCTTDSRYKDIFLSIALCLGWMLSITFTRGFRLMNYFWRLIQIIIVRDLFKFLFIYLFILLAFAFAFQSLFEVSQDIVNLYPNPGYTSFMMFNMMIGMEYIFGDDVVSNGLQAENRRDIFLMVLYVVYMILATILLLNILIAMMNDSYREILDRQQMTWRIESVALGMNVERSLPITFLLFSKVKVIHGHICPSDEKNHILRWYIEVLNTNKKNNSETSSTATDDEKEALSEIRSNMAVIDARVSEQFQSLKDIQSVLKNLEQSLKAHKSQ